MEYIDKIGDNLQVIIQNEDMQKYSQESLINFIKALCGDYFAGLSCIKNTSDLILNIPTTIFWEKMKRFFIGTFHNPTDQIKLAAKFNKDNPSFRKYLRQLFVMVDELDHEMKIDYFSYLTRMFLIEDRGGDFGNYFILYNCLKNLPISTIDFIKKHNPTDKLPYCTHTLILVSNGLAILASNIVYKDGPEAYQYLTTPLFKDFKNLVVPKED